MHEKHEDSPEAYWYKNQKRWKSVLLMAADYADMYELGRPPKESFDRQHPLQLAQQFFWNTTHRRKSIGLLQVEDDPISNPTHPEFDAPTCWACICGECRIMTLSRLDIPILLATSSGRIHDGWRRWDTFSTDFKTSVRGLRGDLAHDALRKLVLGDRGRDARG